MNNASKERVEEAIAGAFGSLDRSHYPPSLIDILERVLCPEKALRGLPLLTCVAGGPEVSEKVLVAQEMLLRGYLLQAELLLPETEKTEGGLISGLRPDFTPGQVLLAADTLFSLPFEILARSGDTEALERFSDVFGPDNLLSTLNRADESFVDFLRVDPLTPLVLAATGGAALSGEWFAPFARWVLLREAGAWFGLRPVKDELQAVANRLDALPAADNAEPPGRGYIELYVFLKER